MIWNLQQLQFREKAKKKKSNWCSFSLKQQAGVRKNSNSAKLIMQANES